MKPILLLWGAVLSAQTTGILDPSRVIDWSGAGAVIPVAANEVACSTVAAGSTVAQINTAITNCNPATGKQGIVSLAAGTYNLTGGSIDIAKSNVTLRGAGANQTFLVFSSITSPSCGSGGTNFCIMDGYTIYHQNVLGLATITDASLPKGTSTIHTGAISGFVPAAGDIAIIDQCNDGLSGNGSLGADGGCGTGTENLASDSGDIWNCSAMGVCSTEGDAGVRRSSSTNATKGRSQIQVVVIQSITATNPYTITFTPPLHMPNWSSARSPQVWWSGTHSVHDIGLENFSYDNTASGSNEGVFISGVRNWWVTGTRSIGSARAAIWPYGATGGTIRNNYFYGSLNGTSKSYIIETDTASNILVENNISQASAAPWVTGESAVGAVYGYNFAVNDYFTGEPANSNPHWLDADSYHHSSALGFHLFEGNIGPGFMSDAIHGTANFPTLFRNRYFGTDVTSDYTGSGTNHGTKNQNTIAIHNQAFNRFSNYVGNVLGQTGFHDTYECYPASTSTASCATGMWSSIFMLGWSGNSAKDVALNNDLNVRTKIMRWGNVDSVSRSLAGSADGARWCASNDANYSSARCNSVSEVPTGITKFSNANPVNRTLSASFYYGAKPGWWPAGKPWPAIGPDVSGGNLGVCSGGTYANSHSSCIIGSSQCAGGGSCVATAISTYANSNPAMDCYLNTMGGPPDGSGAVRSFNAATCYPAGATSAPTVTTTSATSITPTTASSGGNVTADSGATVTARGVCYALTASPTTPCTSDGTGTGVFTSSLTGLTPGALYHYRAYATNSAGTGYGSDLTFTTLSILSITSVSGAVSYSGATGKN